MKTPGVSIRSSRSEKRYFSRDAIYIGLMETDYFIEIGDVRTSIFTLTYDHPSEEPALYDFELKPNSGDHDRLITDLYRQHKGRSIRSSNPGILLRLLLAGGAKLISSNNGFEQTLVKNFFTVRYFAQLGDHTLGLGNFFRTSITNVDEQFPQFCSWIDALAGQSGVAKMTVRQALKRGYSLYSDDGLRTRHLLWAESTGLLDGEPASLAYMHEGNPR